jgi:hypothetical protein
MLFFKKDSIIVRTTDQVMITNVPAGYSISASQVYNYELGPKQLYVRKDYQGNCSQSTLSYLFCVFPFSWLYDDYTSQNNYEIGFENCGKDYASTSLAYIESFSPFSRIIPTALVLKTAYRASCGTNRQRSIAIMGAYLSTYAYQEINGSSPSIKFSLYENCTTLRRYQTFTSTSTGIVSGKTYAGMYAELWLDNKGETAYLNFQGTSNIIQGLTDFMSFTSIRCEYGDKDCGNIAVFISRLILDWVFKWIR